VKSERVGRARRGARALAIVLAAGGILAGGQAGADAIGITSVPIVISQPGSYVLGQDLAYMGSGDAILITSDDVELDGHGHTVTGNASGAGIRVRGASGVTVHAVKVTGFDDGIALLDASNGTLTDNVTNGNASGIVLVMSGKNSLSRNTANGNSNTGFLLFNGSNNNTLADNTTASNVLGIVLVNSNNNTLTGNTASSNTVGIFVEFASSSNRVANNTASSNLIAGIGVAATSAGNTLVQNTARGNAQFDLEDFGLSPCQNGWADNTYETDNETDLAAGSSFGCIR
jgi:parallel beta-helix repeat protein